jgi:hypothetical protein
VLLWSNASGTRTPVNVWVDSVSGNNSNDGLSSGAALQTLQQAFWVSKTLGYDGDGSHVIINLKAGTYAFHSTGSDQEAAKKGWHTYQPAAGVTRDQVIICGNGGDGYCRQWLIHFKNVTLKKLSGDATAVLNISSANQPRIWFEGVNHYGSDKWVTSQFQDGCISYYFTNSALHRGLSTDAKDAMRALVTQNCDYLRISGDGLNYARLFRGGTMVEVTANVGGGDHMDVVQSLHVQQNTYVSDSQFLNYTDSNGFFLDVPKNNLAFINNVFHNLSGTGQGYVSGGLGLLIWHNTFVGFNVGVVTDSANADGYGGAMEISTFSVYGNIIANLSYLEKAGSVNQASFEATLDASTTRGRFARNHYQVGSWFEGDNPTNGSVTWSDAANAVFYPSAMTKTVPRVIPWDVFQNVRSETTRHGAMEYGSYLGVAEAPTISLSSGTYESSRSVTLGLQSGLTGYYTTTGAAPTSASTLYAGSFSVAASCILKAIAYNSIDVASAVTTANYTIITNGTPAPPTNLRLS